MTAFDGYYQFWAKTDQDSDAEIPAYHLLPYHNLDVAATGRELLKQNTLWSRRLSKTLGLDEERLIPFVVFLLALHDIGKFSGSFQHLNEKLCAKLDAGTRGQEYHVRHDTLGYLLWRYELHSVMWDDDWFGIKTLDELAGEDPEGGWDYMDPLAQAITGHHGAPPQPERWHARRFFNETSRQAAITYARNARSLLMPEPPFDTWNYEKHVPKAHRATWLLAGLAVLADWIGSSAGSSSEFFFRFEEDDVQLEEYWSRAEEQAHEAVRSAGLIAPASSTIAAGLHELFPKHAENDHNPTPLQEHATTCSVESGPQLFILEDATGSGKTEGAVILTRHLMKKGEAEGVYFGLPTMATANAMHERLASTYRRLFDEEVAPSYVLAHSARRHIASFQSTIRLENPASNPDETEESPESDQPELTGQAQCTAWLADNRKKALLANVGVGTIDQALIGTLPSRHQSLRLLGLGRNVLVVDDVHAYDEYVSSLLRHVLRFQAAMGGSAILLSATLPETLRQKLCDAFRKGLLDTNGQQDSVEEEHFPLVTHVAPDGEISETCIPRSERSQHHVGVEFFEAESSKENAAIKAHKQVAERLLAVARDNGCACWIRNTVDDAISAWKYLREQHNDPDKVLLFHARFALGDRQTIEEKVLHHFGEESGPKDRGGYTLVATQVVEQSLDLDFDYMVSDLAPIDLLIQRAGRLHRHDRDDQRPDAASSAVLGILAPAFSEDPPDTWYADLFPKGKYVYPHAGHLWRTMKVLKEKERIHIPEEARSLLYAVYREDDLEHPATQDEDEAWGIPSGLLKASNEAVNEAKRASAEANHNALHLEGGYGSLKAGGRRWFNEKRTPTRLGDPTTTVRLACWEDDRLVPWVDDGDELDTLHEKLKAVRDQSEENGWNEERSECARKLRREMADLWQRSELSVRESKISGEATLKGKKKKTAASKIKEKMPDGGKWSVLIVFEEANGEGWTGHANKGHQKRALTYSAKSGLQFDQ